MKGSLHVVLRTAAISLVAACDGGKLVVLGVGQGAWGSSGVGAAGGCGGELSGCGGVCVDTRYDPNHCGACGEACAEGTLCSDGACSVACGSGTVA
jgi:hypothetical protein